MILISYLWQIFFAFSTGIKEGQQIIRRKDHGNRQFTNQNE